jgi:hypothetical protein
MTEESTTMDVDIAQLMAIPVPGDEPGEITTLPLK